MNKQEQEYAGFWIRVGAALIYSVLILIVVMPILMVIYGESYWTEDTMLHGFWDLIFGYVLPAVIVIVFWVYKSATPGKMATKLIIVDAQTGGKPSTRQFIIRYVGYYLAMLPLFLGIIWVGIDKHKQGWHDMLAGTVVLRSTHSEPVKFEDH
jgi:uncharacterized RDD family membrane protein YckC